MTADPRTANRIGVWAATALGVVGVGYAVVTTVGMVQAGLTAPIVDPVLAIMELLTLLSAPLIVVLLAAVHSWAPERRATHSLIALCFGVLMAGLTSSVHFVNLTAGRQSGRLVLVWPSVPYAVELLAWDVFLGLALVFAAAVFIGRGRARAVRWGLGTSGALCLLGSVGPLLGDMTVQRLGMAGYGIGLPVSCFLLAGFFRQESRRPGGEPSPGVRAPERGFR